MSFFALRGGSVTRSLPKPRSTLTRWRPWSLLPSVDPPPLSAAWRSASFRYVDEPTSYADWEVIVLSQIADLADFADQGPLGEHAYFGVDAPRPGGCVRATDMRWYNFDPRGYLECGMAGSMGGWDEDDGVRKQVPGPVVPLVVEPAPGERSVAAVSWAELAELARCGQEYEQTPDACRPFAIQLAA